jgi:hypothetical protein
MMIQKNTKEGYERFHIQKDNGQRMFTLKVIEHVFYDNDGSITSSPLTYFYGTVKCSNEIKAVAFHVDASPVSVDCPNDKFHISLSKCLYLKEFQFDTFKSQIRNGIKSIKP